MTEIMAKKNMDILLGNILGSAAIHPQERYDESPSSVRQNEKQSNQYNSNSSCNTWKHFTFICSVDLACKVQAIARKEGFTIRTFMEYVMKQGIEAYEAKHGKIRKIRTRDINDVM